MAAVVTYHAFPDALPGGFVGVDVFFVISGYLITALLVRERAEAGSFDLAAFYARRVRRLLPALVVMLLGVLALLVCLMGRHERLVSDAAESSLWSLLFAVNFHFQATVGGYFDVAAEERLMLHLWSLAVEEQFYLIYPWILAVVAGGVSGKRMRWLVPVALGSLLLSEYWANVEPAKGFYQMPSRFWELAAGAMVAISPVTFATNRIRQVALPGGLVAILLSCVYTGQWGAFPGKSALPVVLGAALVLWAIRQGEVGGRAAAILRSRMLVALGLVSYSLYLWHWPLLVMVKQARIEHAGPGLRFGACALALLLAALSWRFVETPVRRLRIENPWRWLGSAMLAIVMVGGVVVGLSKLDRVPVGARVISDTARNDVPSIQQHCHFDGNHEVLALLPPACNSRPSQLPTFALWGDSHALSWQPFVWRLADVSRASAAPLTLNSCPPGAVHGERVLAANCARFNRLALAWLSSKPLDTLVIAQRWPRASAHGASVPVHLAQRVNELDAALRTLGHVRRIVVMGPLPTMERAAPDCIALGWERECGISTERHRERVAPVWRELEALSVRHQNVVLLDPVDYFCDVASCPPLRRGIGLYRDDNHITASASRGFADAYLTDEARYTRRPHGGTPMTNSP